MSCRRTTYGPDLPSKTYVLQRLLVWVECGPTDGRTSGGGSVGCSLVDAVNSLKHEVSRCPEPCLFYRRAQSQRSTVTASLRHPLERFAFTYDAGIIGTPKY